MPDTVQGLRHSYAWQGRQCVDRPIEECMAGQPAGIPPPAPSPVVDESAWLAYLDKLAAKGPGIGDLLAPLIENLRLLSTSDIYAVAEWIRITEATFGPMNERVKVTLAARRSGAESA